MRPFIAVRAARRRPGTGLLYLVTSGLLWGTGGLTGSLLSRTAGLSALSVAAYRLTVGGLLIVVFLTVTGRRWPAGRAAWTRIAVIGRHRLYMYFASQVTMPESPMATPTKPNSLAFWSRVLCCWSATSCVIWIK